VLDWPGSSEEVVCLASPKELGLALPAPLKTPDLTPMPVASLDEVVSTYRRLDGTLVEARLPIRVTN
jgi:hypothetical protein